MGEVHQHSAGVANVGRLRSEERHVHAREVWVQPLGAGVARIAQCTPLAGFSQTVSFQVLIPVLITHKQRILISLEHVQGTLERRMHRRKRRSGIRWGPC